MEKSLITAEPNNAPKRLSPGSNRFIGKTPFPTLGFRMKEENAPKPPPAPARIARPHKPELEAFYATAPPRIDGELSEELWQKAPSLIGSAEPAKEQTDVRIAYDAQALYLGIMCWESRMNLLVAEYTPAFHDMDVFLDDSVEVLVEPTKGWVWRFGLNALGSKFDGRKDDTVNPLWTGEVRRWSNRWSAEIRIPFDSLASEPPSTDERWRINVLRNENPRGEKSAWTAELEGSIAFRQGIARPAEKITDTTLIVHLTFDDIAGRWVRDTSGHRHHGLMTAPMQTVAGRIGKALRFTGSGFVEIGSATYLDLTTSATLALWVYLQRRGSMRLIDKTPAGGSDGYLLDTHPNGNIRFISRPTTVCLDYNLPLRNWAHIAAVFESGTLRIFVNSELVSESKGGKALSKGKLPLRLGADSNGRNRFVGLMDDVRVYSKALNRDEILAILKSASP